MSNTYDNYLTNHISNVRKACEWIFKNCDYNKLIKILPELQGINLDHKYTANWFIDDHDKSKYNMYEEYKPYDEYFNGPNGIKNGDGPSKEVQEKFNYAWLHHIHNNPHHWQYWLLTNDDPENGIVALEMPDHYILEMICDWWSFSWSKGNLYELFNWWDDHGDYIMLGEETRHKVIELLGLILDRVNELGIAYGGIYRVNELGGDAPE